MKRKTSLTLRQKRLLASNNKDDFFTLFNEIHNSHLLSTGVGQVTVKTTDEEPKTKLEQMSRLTHDPIVD